MVELPRLPLVGQIAAGGPLLAEQNVEDEIAVPEPLGRNADSSSACAANR